MAEVPDNEDKTSKASGDVKLSEEKIFLPPPIPNPTPIPDVQLVVDGFGFMPNNQGSSKRKSSFSDQGMEEMFENEPDQKSYSCESSTNLNVVRRYTWTTKNKMIVQVISYGATITSIQVPDKKGNPDDVVAGFETLEEYLQPRNPYFGATIGRYANFIRDGTFSITPTGKMHMLSLNKGHHHYNGGHIGFDKVNWRSYIAGNKVIMSHVSDRFDEGYPGSLMTQITFEVTCDNTMKITMKCTTTEPTIVNLTHAPFFNLAGHYSGPETLYDHIITINADKYTPTNDEDGIVTGEKRVVGGTPYDLRVPRSLRAMLPKISCGGFNHNFCVTQGIEQELTFHARAVHPYTGRVVELYSNKPGVQFYTGNDLPDPDKILEPISSPEDEENEEKPEADEQEGIHDEASDASEKGEESSEEEREGKVGMGYVPLAGKGGTFYKRHGLFCFMPQNYPNAVNNKHFPKSILNPGEVYVHRIEYKFGLLLGRYV